MKTIEVFVILQFDGKVTNISVNMQTFNKFIFRKGVFFVVIWYFSTKRMTGRGVFYTLLTFHLFS